MRQRAIHTILLLLLLCVGFSACAPGNLQLSGGVATVFLDEGKAGDIKSQGESALRALQNGDQSVHDLVFTGEGSYKGPEFFRALGETAITAITVEGPIPYDLQPWLGGLPDYKRLTALHLNQPVSNIPALLDILRACPALEELTIGPGGAGYYVLYKGLRADGRLKTVNGQALAEWDPFSELEAAQDQYNFTVGGLDEEAYALEEELGAFERSEEAPPGSDGPILIADKKQDDPLTFHAPYREGFAVRYEDCAALAVVLKEYEYAGRYADGTGGYRGTFSVQIIDLQTQTRYAPIEWQTVEPPAEKMGDGDVYPSYRLDGGDTEETTGPALLDLLADMGYWTAANAGETADS